MEPATVAGFSFVVSYRSQKRCQNVKHVNYYPARLSRGKKWYALFRFRNPETLQFESFKVYEDINRIKDKQEKEEFGKILVDAINRKLKLGCSPFEVEYEEFKEPKTWTIQTGVFIFQAEVE